MGMVESNEEPLVGEVMSTLPVMVLPSETVERGARVMAEEGIGSLIVVDEEENLLGIVTKTDIVYKVVARGEDPARTLIAAIMTRNPYYIVKTATLREAAEEMGLHNIGHLPVIDPETSKVVGVISKSDILRLAPHYMTLVYVSRPPSVGEESE